MKPPAITVVNGRVLFPSIDQTIDTNLVSKAKVFTPFTCCVPPTVSLTPPGIDFTDVVVTVRRTKVRLRV